MPTEHKCIRLYELHSSESYFLRNPHFASYLSVVTSFSRNFDNVGARHGLDARTVNDSRSE